MHADGLDLRFSRRCARNPLSRYARTWRKGYDPAEDIGVHETQAHLMLAVMKALDPQQEAVLEAVKAAQQRPGMAANRSANDAA